MHFKLSKSTWIVGALLLLFVFPAFSQTYTVNTVPNPKTDRQDFFVSNPDGVLTTLEVETINRICEQIKRDNSAEVCVVVVNSIGSEDPDEFATELFTKWGIGSASNDNGLLILLPMEQRTVVFRTGYGTETILPDTRTYQIQQEYMVPRFKDGQHGQGLIDGINAVAAAFETGVIEYENDRPNAAMTELDAYGSTFRPWWYDAILIYLMVMALPLLIFGLMLLIAKLQPDLFKKYNTMKLFTLLIWVFLFPIPFVFIRMLTKKLMENWRNTIRISPKTGMPMHKMSEQEEDAYLTAGQISEERLRSIDYDVWVGAEGDNEDRIILAYSKWFSSYSKCPKCKYKTWQKDYDRIIVSPTTYSSGRGEKKHSCGNCNHSRIQSYVIPRIPRRTSSSGSSGGSFGGGGGGSWGGGSTGGGGSSSSW